MKVILDTNVFISGVFFSGPPYQILRAWQDAKIELMISPDILDEYRRVGKILAEDHPGVDLSPMLEFVIQTAPIYSAPPLSDAVCKDPETISSSLVLWPAGARLSSVEISTCLRRQDIGGSKC